MFEGSVIISNIFILYLLISTVIISQVRAPLHESATSAAERVSILKDLAYAEGCYGGHYTLEVIIKSYNNIIY